MNSKLERIWKEAVVAFFEALFWHGFEGTNKKSQSR
jgi:hypothetical protein